jgi:hypothetical protein
MGRVTVTVRVKVLSGSAIFLNGNYYCHYRNTEYLFNLSPSSLPFSFTGTFLSVSVKNPRISEHRQYVPFHRVNAMPMVGPRNHIEVRIDTSYNTAFKTCMNRLDLCSLIWNDTLFHCFLMASSYWAPP